ncbi:MAG: hypothetical protein IPJ61_14010 [Tessaracoccus sp.]|uniref:hypothetical protein n=1 Tax=Tessaracoccus sp. TaxID=1971211 RepID=UPI001EB13150|nr:hypothetical protein [Tessaracoccus sp.]MBK7822138.1 hypothetical protein [Tessaracoccus sp.]
MTTRRAEITAFQERAGYDRSIDLRTDVVMAYGMDDTTVQRVADWRSAGYRVHIMTGISWGHYEDYLDGRWNGVEHWGDAQTNRHGETILHGPGVPYMVPTIDFTEYLFAKLRPSSTSKWTRSTSKSPSSGRVANTPTRSGGNGGRSTASRGSRRTRALTRSSVRAG